MAKDWYVRVMGEVVGPMEPGEVQSMAKSKRLGEFDEIRHGAAGRWVPASDIKGIKFGDDPPEPGSIEAVAADTLAAGEVAFSGKWNNPVYPHVPERTDFKHSHGVTTERVSQLWPRIFQVAKTLVIAFFALVVIAALFTSSGRNSAKDDDREAMSVAKDSVLKKLKAPSTAEFPSDSIKVDKIEANAWRVIGHVDAQNAFGAKLRNTWSSVVEKGGDGAWKVRETVLIGH